VAAEAAEEAESLLALLGIAPRQLQEVSVAKLLPITVSHADEDWYNGVDIVSKAEQLQDLIRQAENNNKDIQQLAEASALVTADEFMRVYVTYA
jgi:UDP-N-acetylenolpyruvoylglucosamine reductase